MAIGKIGKSMGDSGTFGSRKTMNAIGKAQQTKKKSPFTAKGNAVAKGMVTGKYQSPNALGRVKKAAGKMFGL